MAADREPVPFGRAAGALLLLACLLLLGFAVALAREDRRALTTVLIVFAIVSVPALLSAVLGLPDAVRLLRDRTPTRSTPTFAGLLAVGHLGVVALSLRPGLDRDLDDGDLLGGAVGAVGALSGLTVLALTLPARTLGVRLVGALGVGVLVLAVLVLRAVTQLDQL